MVTKMSRLCQYISRKMIGISLLGLLICGNVRIIGGTCTVCPGAPQPPVSTWTVLSNIYSTQCIGTLITSVPYLAVGPGIFTLCSDLTYSGTGAAITVSSGSLEPTFINLACHKLTTAGDGIVGTPGSSPFSVFNGVLELTGAGTLIEGFVQNVDKVQLIGAGVAPSTGVMPTASVTSNAGISTLISNSTFRNMSVGIDLTATNEEVEIEGCRFDGSAGAIGGTFMPLGNSNVVIRDSTFSSVQGTLMSGVSNELTMYNNSFQDAVINSGVLSINYFDFAGSNLQFYDCVFSNIILFSTTSNFISLNNSTASFYRLTFGGINLLSTVNPSALINAINASRLGIYGCDMTNIFINGGTANIINIQGNLVSSARSQVNIWDTLIQNVTFSVNPSNVININLASVTFNRSNQDRINENAVISGSFGIQAQNADLTIEDSTFTTSRMLGIVTLAGVNLILANSDMNNLVGTGIVATNSGTGIIRGNTFNSLQGDYIVISSAANTFPIAIQSNILNHEVVGGSFGIRISNAQTQAVYNNVVNNITTAYSGVTSPILPAASVTSDTGFYTNVRP